MAAKYYFVSQGLVVNVKQYYNGVKQAEYNIEKKRFINVLANGSTTVSIYLSPIAETSVTHVRNPYVGNSLGPIPYANIYIASTVQSSATGAATNLRTLVANTVTVS